MYNMRKCAFSPFTDAAQQAPQAPTQEGGAMGGQPVPQGGQAPQQDMSSQLNIVQGPNGEMIDQNTGFIVLDAQQGILQDPLTGILLNLSTQEFATPDGQLLDPQEAQQQIEQAYMQQQQQQQGGQAPQGDPAMQDEQGTPMEQPTQQVGQPTEQPMQGSAPTDPTDPTMAQGQAAPQGGQGQTYDPETGMYVDDATGMPVDPQTGMLVDPSTGQQIDPTTGQIVTPNMEAQAVSDDPAIQQELMGYMQSLEQKVERQDKGNATLSRKLDSARTDIQGLRREVQSLGDKSDAAIASLENTAALLEDLLQHRG